MRATLRIVKGRGALRNSATASDATAPGGGLGVGGSCQLYVWTHERRCRAWSRPGRPWRAVDIGDILRAVEIFLLAGLAPQIKYHWKSFQRWFGGFPLRRSQGFFNSRGQRNWLTTGATIDSRVLLRYGCLGHGTPQFEVTFCRVGRDIIQLLQVRK